MSTTRSVSEGSKHTGRWAHLQPLLPLDGRGSVSGRRYFLDMHLRLRSSWNIEFLLPSLPRFSCARLGARSKVSSLRRPPLPFSICSQGELSCHWLFSMGSLGSEYATHRSLPRRPKPPKRMCIKIQATFGCSPRCATWRPLTVAHPWSSNSRRCSPTAVRWFRALSKAQRAFPCFRTVLPCDWYVAR